MARERPRSCPHAQPERRVPPPQRLQAGGRPHVCGCVHPSRDRPADVSHLGGARREAAARRPLPRTAARARSGEGLTVPGLYLLALLVSFAGIALLDLRWRLAFPVAPGRTAAAVAIATAFFLIWDAVGI